MVDGMHGGTSGEIYAHMVSFQVVTHPGEKLFLGHTRDELIANFHGDIIP